MIQYRQFFSSLYPSLQILESEMPTLKLADAFLSGLCGSNGRLMGDHEFCSIYNLPDDFFLQHDIEHIKPQEAQGLKSFILAALAKPDNEMLTAFLSGTVMKMQFSDNNHHQGRQSYRSWFRKMKISSKIHSLVEEALLESETHPRQILESQSSANIANDTLPEMRSIYTTAERAVAQGVYGRNALTSVVVPHSMSTATSCLLHHAWERLRKQRKRSLEKLNSLRSAVQEAKNSKQ
jgi:hypothetical protein